MKIEELKINGKLLAVCVAAGFILGLAFAVFTISRWRGRPTHVWPFWMEYLYTIVALSLLVCMKTRFQMSIYPTAMIVATCGMYHLVVGIAKQTRRP